MKLTGKSRKFGDDLDTDVIIPAKYLASYDPEFLGTKCMEPLDPGFAGRVNAGDIIVGGENFGCGSSREHAVLALKGVGISCIVAKSFARIFFRNCINQGLPLMVSIDAADAIGDGDAVEVDPSSGVIDSGGRTFRADPLPEAVLEIVASGGLVPHARRILGVTK